MSAWVNPDLTRTGCDGVFWHEDPTLRSQHGVVVAFSERLGGSSSRPYASLNLAAHVGDSPATVDANRAVLLTAMGLGPCASGLTCAEQVHGDGVGFVTQLERGSGGMVDAGRPPVADADALITDLRLTPLMLFFADCVPVVLVAPRPAVAVAHAGWRGALSGIAAKTALALAANAGCSCSDLVAYIGAHIGPCHYQVSDEIMSQFVNVFGTFARAESGGLDLGAVVTSSLIDAGVSSCSIAALGVCTAEAPDRFFSYRAEGGLTGRHGAIGCIL